MSMNLSALNMFRSALDWNNKGVANLDHKYAVLNDHEYGGWLSSIGRNDDEKEANNKVRTILPNGGVRKEGVYGPYAEKLATIQRETRQAERHVRAFFNRVGIILDYIYNELDIEREKPEDRDPSALRYLECIADDYESGKVDEIGPKAFREYFRVDPRGAKA